MLEITVPCRSCGAPLGFAQSKCGGCARAPSRAERAALRARLSASSEDFRALDDQVSAARTVLLMVGLAYLAQAIFGLVFSRRAAFTDPELDAAALAQALYGLALGAVFAGCWLVGRAAPLSAIAAAIGAWLIVQLLSASVPISASMFAGLWFKAAVTILLARGLFAAVRAQRMLSELRRQA